MENWGRGPALSSIAPGTNLTCSRVRASTLAGICVYPEHAVGGLGVLRELPQDGFQIPVRVAGDTVDAEAHTPPVSPVPAVPGDLQQHAHMPRAGADEPVGAGRTAQKPLVEPLVETLSLNSEQVPPAGRDLLSGGPEELQALGSGHNAFPLGSGVCDVLQYVTLITHCKCLGKLDGDRRILRRRQPHCSMVMGL